MKLSSIFVKHPDFAAVQVVVNTLRVHNHEVYLAGGCVRDGLLGVLPKDFDVATSAKPEEVEGLFAKTIPVGKAFGVILVMEQGVQVEVATFRHDLGSADGRRPESVEFCSAKEDVLRRDFTVNAMLFDLAREEIIDYVDGLRDLNAKQIRAVGNPDTRFQEDHLRLLRAVRFSAQLGFQIEPKTWQAVVRQSHLISSVSGERVFEELSKFLSSPGVNQSIGILVDSQLLQNYFPGTAWNQAEWQKVKGPSELSQWFGFFTWAQRCNPAMTLTDIEQMCDRLRFGRKLKQDVLAAVRWKYDLPQLLTFSLGHVIELGFDSAKKMGLDYFVEQSSETQIKNMWKKAEERLQVLAKAPEPLLRAADLPATLKGAAIGEALRAVYHAQLEGVVKDKAEALDLLKSRGK